MNERKPFLSPPLAIFLYALACGFMLILFHLIPGFIRYLFSLFAFYGGFNFFRKYDETKHRVLLIVFAMVIYFIGVVVYVAFAIVNGWTIPGVPDNVAEMD